jgi:hypothetical protein
LSDWIKIKTKPKKTSQDPKTHTKRLKKDLLGCGN